MPVRMSVTAADLGALTASALPSPPLPRRRVGEAAAGVLDTEELVPVHHER
jgi:hypothetical protein